jgi:hypothetical protein
MALWLRLVRQRQLAALKLQKVSDMENLQMLRILRRYADMWYSRIHSAVTQRHVGALHRSEEEQRARLQDIYEPGEYHHITVLSTSSIDGANRSATGRRVDALAETNKGKLLLRYLGAWGHRAERRLRRVALLPAVETLAARNKLARAYHLWARATRLAKVLRRLAVMQQQTEHRVLRKYYLRLAPRMVRLAKVSRARSNLEDAQRAAKILGLADISGGSARPAAALRLAPLRPADSVPPPTTQDNPSL